MRLPRRSLPTLSCLLTFVFIHTAQAADWPTYLVNPSRTGAATESLKAPFKPGWSYTPPSTPRRSFTGGTGRTIEGKVLRDRVRYDDAFHVAVVGDRIYFGSSADHKLYCRDAGTGKELWSTFTGGPIRLAPTVADGKVYVGSDDGHAYCLNAADGKIVWKLRAGPSDEWLLARGDMVSRWPVRTGVLVDGGIAYFAAGIFPHDDIYLYAVEAASGKILWKQDNISESEAGRNDLSPQGYLLASETTLFVPSGRTLPAAFDRKTGEPMHKATASWRGNGGGVIGGTRGLLADGQLYSGAAHHYLAIDQKTGKVGFGYIDGKQLAVVGDAAYTITGTHASRLDRLKVVEASRTVQKLEAEISSTSRRKRGAKKEAAAKYRAEIAAAQKKIKALEKALEDEGIVWQVSADHEDALIVTGDLVIAGGEKSVTAFDANSGEEVWNTKVEGAARGLAVANGRLYVSTTTGHIYSFDGAETKAAPVAPATPLVKNPYPQDDLTAMYESAAEGILKQMKSKKGFGLVLGSERGRLVYELAKRSDLEFYCIEPDEEKVAESRRILASTGMYGSRITVHHADYSAIPYSNYFANLIVSDNSLLTGKIPGRAKEIARHLKPLGGVICLGGPEKARVAESDIKTWFAQTGYGEYSRVRKADQWVTLTRGKLPGAANWSHLYGDPGNTASSEDTRVKGGLGVLWFGDPGPGKMVNRHEGAVGPLAVNGRLFVQGEDSVMAYDSYNGQFLWERGNEGALRSGVFQNYNPGNLVASENALFVMIKDECAELDAATGEIRKIHKLPADKQEKYQWGYLAYRDGRLYGTATLRNELASALRRRGRKFDEATDAIFAVDTKTGKHLWTFQGKSISHHTIAVGPGRVYFIDSTVTSDQRADILRQDKSRLKGLKGDAAKRAEELLKKQDLRLAVAIDAVTGKQLWSTPVDVTDCSEIGIGGGQLTLMYQNNVLLLCGANANGHYWKQFIGGDFSRRRLVALSGDDGQKLWAKDANYRHRPIIIGDEIVAEPWGFDLYTGVQKMRSHPLTGEQVPWSLIRPGHHCGMLTGSPSMLMFRSGYTGFYDRDADAGTRHFAGHRLGCWINAIPANGLVMIPEASAGCVCLFSIASTIIMEPREARRPWTIYSAIGPKTPVKHMTLNFGAPGDRKDARGKMWLAYPRPNPKKTTGLDLQLDFKHQALAGGGFTTRNNRSLDLKTDEADWLFSSKAQGVKQLTVPLLGKEDKAATYTVKLHFAEIEANVQKGDRVFDVKLQGETAVDDLDVLVAAKGHGKNIVREISGVKVTDSLVIELVSKATTSDPNQMPILNAIEILREE